MEGFPTQSPAPKQENFSPNPTPEVDSGVGFNEAGVSIAAQEPEVILDDVEPQTNQDAESVLDRSRKERRSEIIKELESEWEQKNGPMFTSLTKSEIDNNKQRAKIMGEEWDGRTTRMTDKASEFYFNHSGTGLFSVPRMADRILADRFPEYAAVATPSESENALNNTGGNEYVSEQIAPEPVRKVELATVEDELVAHIVLRDTQPIPLNERVIIDSASLRDFEYGLDSQSDFMWVDTNHVVGRPAANTMSEGWGHEYENRTGRIEEIELGLLSCEPKSIEEVFHINKPNERIKLFVIEGPVGPIYSVEDGTHRVAGSMKAGLSEIPCEVKKMRFPFSFSGSDDNQAFDIQRKINLGLIQGEIEEVTTDDGSVLYKFMIKSEVVPWIHTTSQNDMIRISRAYEKVYPDAYKDLKVPRDILVDPIANNYYLAGRWSEWVAQFNSSERDENGVVKYN